MRKNRHRKLYEEKPKVATFMDKDICRLASEIRTRDNIVAVKVGKK